MCQTSPECQIREPQKCHKVENRVRKLIPFLPPERALPERAKTSNRELENAANCQKMPESARIAAESQKEPRWTLKDFPQVFPKLFPEVFARLPESQEVPQRAKRCHRVPESAAHCQREPGWTPPAFPQVFHNNFFS